MRDCGTTTFGLRESKRETHAKQKNNLFKNRLLRIDHLSILFKNRSFIDRTRHEKKNSYMWVFVQVRFDFDW